MVRGTEEWLPREWKRKRGRPPTKWRDELVKAFGITWSRIGRDRRLWKRTMKAYAHLWVCSVA